jgi:hypothetical protein
MKKMKKATSLLAIGIFLLHFSVSAQFCPAAKKTSEMHVNQIRASVSQGGRILPGGNNFRPRRRVKTMCRRFLRRVCGLRGLHLIRRFDWRFQIMARGTSRGRWTRRLGNQIQLIARNGT